jgi:hypothetical protein
MAGDNGLCAPCRSDGYSGAESLDSHEPGRRVFFALWPDDGLRTSLWRATREAVRASGGQPMPAHNLHVTLVFLGSVADRRIPELEAIADRVAAASCSNAEAAALCSAASRMVVSSAAGADAPLQAAGANCYRGRPFRRGQCTRGGAESKSDHRRIYSGSQAIPRACHSRAKGIAPAPHDGH